MVRETKKGFIMLITFSSNPTPTTPTARSVQFGNVLTDQLRGIRNGAHKLLVKEPGNEIGEEIGKTALAIVILKPVLDNKYIKRATDFTTGLVETAVDNTAGFFKRVFSKTKSTLKKKA